MMNRNIHFFRFMPLKPGDLFSILYFLFTALLLIAPALFNRYPLVYSDSGTYINSSFGLVPPDDRPIGYGYFIRIFSWQASMWPVVFFQGLIGSILIFKTLQLIECKKDVFHYHLPVVVILTLFSSLGWYASQLMPDILVSYQFLVVFLFAFQKTKVIPSLIYLLLFLTFNTTHYSTLLVTVLLLTIIFIYTFFGKKDAIRLLAVKKLGILFLAWFCSYQFLMLNNQANGNGYTLSNSSNVFLIARLSETGILKEYLDSNCNTHAFSLCAFKDNLPPSAAEFIWERNGPFQKSGMSWTQANYDYSFIIRDIFTTPKYYPTFIWESLKATIKQLFQVEIGQGLTPYREDSAPFMPISSKLGSELNEYMGSDQFAGDLNFKEINLVSNVVLLISIIIIFLSSHYSQTNTLMKKLTLIVLLGLLLNAAVTASLANVYARLQSRVVWLMVFLALICLIDILRNLNRNLNFRNYSNLKD